MSRLSVNIEVLRCPICLGQLTNDLSQSLLVCDKGHEFVVKGDIPIFSKDPNFYYGEIPEEEMNQLLGELEQPGNFEDKFATFIRSKTDQFKDSLLRYIFDPHRSAFSFQLPIHQNSTVLDVGCGWGSISIQLQDKVGQIHGMDLTHSRLRFFNNWLSAKNINNISIVCGGDTQFLPYKDNFFDLVLLNGILEWTPLSFEGDPEEVQLNYLREVRRILKDDGYLYLAIENRYGYKYFLGKPDDHSNLLFGSLLPRWMANYYSKLAADKPYRTYTYSFEKYRQLLNQAGFPLETTHSVLPNYRYPQYYVPADIRTSLDDLQGPGRTKSLKERARRNIRKVVRFPRFAPAFSIVAGEKKYRGLILEILNGNYPDYEWSINRIVVTATKVVLVSCVGNSKGAFPKDLLIRLPLCDYAEAQCLRNYVVMSSIHKNDLKIATKVPKPIKEGVLNNRRYFIEEFIEGFSGSLRSGLDPSDFKETLLLAYHFIVEMGKETLQPSKDGEGLEVLRDRIAVIEKFPWEESSQKIISSAYERVVSEYQTNQMPSVMSHNDFHLGNVILDQHSDQLNAVIDWNFAQTKDVPGMDLLHLFVRAYKPEFSGNLPTTIQKIVLGDESDFQELISKYNDELGISVSRETQLISYLLLLIERNIRAIRGLGIGNLYYSGIQKENTQLVQLLGKLLDQ